MVRVLTFATPNETGVTIRVLKIAVTRHTNETSSEGWWSTRFTTLHLAVPDQAVDRR